MNTVIGVAETASGLASREELRQGIRGPELRFNAWRTDSAWLNSVQPREIPVDRDHSGPAIGRVLHIERHEADQGNVWLVAKSNWPTGRRSWRNALATE